MSRRKRHPARQSKDQQIEWLKHRTGYPSPKEREQIIRLRKQLAFEIIQLAVIKASPDDPRYRELINQYGKDEVAQVEKTFKEGMDNPSRVADDAGSYRDYRLRYARFGAGLKYYTSKEVDELYDIQARQFTQSLESEYTSIPGNETEVEKLLLLGWRDWEDITPPAIPPRSADYNVPQPASYPAPINELLEWGDQLNRRHDFLDEKDYLHWKKFIPALTHMALDPGLLNSWPSENASWAPWHATHSLGTLQAWESAPALAELADIENDWLSDHLPHIWADMGLEVEPTLWMILENSSASAKQRGLAAESLYMLTDDNEVMENKVVKGFEKILKHTKTFNPTVNGYLIMFINDMEAQDDIEETIDAVFNDERVDLDIITPEDLEEDEFNDDFDFDDDFDDDNDDDE